MNKKTTILIIIISIVYLSGYSVARYSNFLIHGKGYMTKDGRKVVAAHYIRQGDFGIPLFAPIESSLASGASFIYLPVKPIEKLFWYIKEPIGSNWY